MTAVCRSRFLLDSFNLLDLVLRGRSCSVCRSFWLGVFYFTRRLVGTSGFEPPTSRLSGVRSNQLSYEPIPGGDERVRTDGLLLARQALSQLSYTPVFGCDQLSRSTLQQSEDVLTPSKPYSAFDVS